MGITHLRGLEGETAVLNRLIQLGYEVLHPWNSYLGYDLAYVMTDEESKVVEFVRVQCKMARLSKDQACLIFNTCSCAEWGRKKHNYHGQAEMFGVYSPNTGKVYMIPVAGSGKGSEIHLRLAPTKNNQEKVIRWAKDYEI